MNAYATIRMHETDINTQDISTEMHTAVNITLYQLLFIFFARKKKKKNGDDASRVNFTFQV